MVCGVVWCVQHKSVADLIKSVYNILVCCLYTKDEIRALFAFLNYYGLTDYNKTHEFGLVKIFHHLIICQQYTLVTTCFVRCKRFKSRSLYAVFVFFSLWLNRLLQNTLGLVQIFNNNKIEIRRKPLKIPENISNVKKPLQIPETYF